MPSLRSPSGHHSRPSNLLPLREVERHPSATRTPMTFQSRLPFRTRSRDERMAFFIAVVVTVASFALVLSRADVRAAFGTREVAQDTTEKVRFTVITPREMAATVPSSVKIAPVAPRSADAPALQPREQQSIAAPAVVPDSGQRIVNSPLLSPSPRLLPSLPRQSIGERLQSLGSFAPRELTAAEKDSVLRERAFEFAEAAARRVPTAAEKDEHWKEAGRPGTIPGRTAGEQGFIATRGGGVGGSIPFSLFGAGPSAAERKKQEAAAAEGLAILARIQERVRKKKDSLRVSDSLARLGRAPQL
jgi:hypothetical protein